MMVHIMNKYICSVQLLSHVQLFVTPWPAACQASLSFTISQCLLKLMSIELVILTNHLSLCHPLLLFPSVFLSISLFQWIGSLHQVAKVLEFQLQLQYQSLQWNSGFGVPLGLTGWSACWPRDSQESSPAPQLESIISSALTLLYGPTLTSIHDYWKKHRFD